ncbi:hypothetical protein Bbelb_013320 [Branchiostoma belcheri]|nr:hypothetical protein Bbelb_013320 [Branchiostoma belcheri]
MELCNRMRFAENRTASFVVLGDESRRLRVSSPESGGAQTTLFVRISSILRWAAHTYDIPQGEPQYAGDEMVTSLFHGIETGRTIMAVLFLAVSITTSSPSAHLCCVRHTVLLCRRLEPRRWETKRESVRGAWWRKNVKIDGQENGKIKKR